MFVPEATSRVNRSFAVAPQQRVAQHRPQLELADTRTDRRLELGEHRVPDAPVDREERDLFRRLHLARVDRRGTDIGDRDAFLLQGQESGGIDLVDGEALALEPELAQGRTDRARPLARLVTRAAVPPYCQV